MLLTLAGVLGVLLVVVAGVALGRRLARGTVGYHRAVIGQARERRQPLPAGMCRGCRRKPAMPGSAYCSPEHETDDDWHISGY